MKIFCKRAVAAAVLAAFYGVCFYATVCTSLCEYGVCPQRVEQPIADHCADASSATAHPHHGEQGKRCSGHHHPDARFIAPAVPSLGAGLAAGEILSARASARALITNPFTAARPAFAHAPPGFCSGKTICRKDSLLRI